MRLLFLAAALGLATTAAASADEVVNARAAYAERRGLLEADAQCRLFTADIRTALQISAAQARGSLLRSGWTDAQMRELEQAAIDAARARRCGDARTASAAEDARHAFARWSAAGTMQFPGWERTWTARRAVTSDPAWRLSQTIDTPVSATFGVRERDGVQHLVLVLPLARGATAPASVTLIMRDAQRARVTEVSLPQRMSQGLAAGAPAPNAALSVPSTRTIERISGGRSQAVFTFPDTAFRGLLALDPRESIELRAASGRNAQSFYVEVGDVGAARAFLTLN
ncbi:MAG: hypothetical protein K2X34_02330 [Hyphomonadaceae bacterium]|nr:hypothetical protein [Hyphomonadaceae bacterium]